MQPVANTTNRKAVNRAICFTKAIINNPSMTLLQREAKSPTVSVIVPARNEEDCLGRCLESLVAQAIGDSELVFEIIVVDDRSTDRTREIALAFPAVQVIDADPLPKGWTGKCNAVACGARVAQGAWLLFTDADTAHKPGSLARALREAQDDGAALLSYSPEQVVHSLLEKAAMPVIFAELAARYRPDDVSNPASSAAAANGQYILVSLEAYDAVGGHAAVAGSLLEDVELARLVKRSGRRILFRSGAAQVSTRMYRSAAQLVEGWTKNLALLFPNAAWLAVLRGLEFAAIGGTGGLAMAAALKGNPGLAWWMGIIWTLVMILFVRRISRAHFAWDASLLAVFGLPIFSFLLLRSVISYRRGRVVWKGRSYAGGAAS